MQSSKKTIVYVIVMMCLFCMKSFAQPVQLPSLFNEPEVQDNYLKNSVLKPGENPIEKIHNFVFIKTSISKKDCFVGEPILVTYQLYTAVSCHSRVTKQVSFNGCSVIEMTADEPEQVQKEGGKIYRVQLIRKVQLIPLQAGDLILSPVTVNNEVGFSTVNNSYRQTTYAADISSETYTIHVAALPEQPDKFNGITGEFSITAKTDSTTFAAGENNRLQVTIAGSGNIEAITEPKIEWPKNTEHFDPTDSQHINRMNFPESGDKTFSFPFISTKKGRLTVPEISFTYFNTDLKKFETVTTKAIPLIVTTAVKKRNPVAMISNDLSNQKYLWFVPGIAIIVIAIWLLANRNQKKPAINKLPVVQTEIKSAEIIEEPVKPDYELLLIALSEAEDNKTFFTNVKTLLTSALQFKFSPKQEDETILVNILQNRDEALANEAKQMIATCNQSLYSPVEDEAVRSRIVEQLSGFINQLERA